MLARNYTILSPVKDNYFPGMEGVGHAYDILLMNGYKIMHVMGDTDGMITMPGTWKWIKDRKLKQTQPWTPYLQNDELLGYIKQYSNLTLVTIHGEG